MPNSKTFSSGVAHPSTRYWIDLIVEELEVDRDNNRSKIHFDLRARSEYTWDLEFSGRLGYIEIDENNDGKWTRIASSYTNLAAYDGDGGAYNKRITHVTKWITHNASGALSFKVKGYYDYSNILISHKWWLSPVSVTGTFATTTINRTPTLSVSIRSRSAESVSFNWRSNIPAIRLRYRHSGIDRTISTTVDSKKSGVLTVNGLSPGTSYTFNNKTGFNVQWTKIKEVWTCAVGKIQWTSVCDWVNMSNGHRALYRLERYGRINKANAFNSIFGDKEHQVWIDYLEVQPMGGVDKKGSSVGTVTSTSSTAYPNNGVQGGYWYVANF